MLSKLLESTSALLVEKEKNLARKKKLDTLFYSGVIGVLYIFAYFIYCKDIDLVIALGGFSPVGWVEGLMNPENFKRDFPSGTHTYAQSLIMQIYPFFSRFFEPINVMRAYICIQLAAPIVFFFWLFKYFFKLEKFLLAVVIAYGLYVLSNFRQVNWGMWNTPGFRGQFYDIVDLFCLSAFFLRIYGRKYVSILFLFLALASHPLKGAATLALINFYWLGREKDFSGNIINSIKYSIIVAIPTGLWIYFAFQGKAIGVQGIEPETWVRFSKVFNSHYFPTGRGFFTYSYYRHFFDFLVFMATSVFLYTSSGGQGYYHRFFSGKGLVFGVFGILLLTGAGIIFSVYSTSPFVIKLALHRTNEVLASLGVILFTVSLHRESTKESGITFYLMCGALVLYSFSFGFWSPLYFIPLIFLGVIKNKDFSYKKNWLIAVALILVLFFIFGAVYGAPKKIYFILPVSVLCTSLLLWACFKRVSFIQSVQQKGLFVVLVALLSGGIYTGYRVGNKDFSKHLAFKSAQIWASKNSSRKSLFLVDPTIYYGWREFSKRSSFGNLREWLHTSWLYDSSEENYTEGLRRFQSFGLSIEKYIEKPGLRNFFKLNNDFKERFYSLPSSIQLKIIKNFNVDFFVIQRKEKKKESVFLGEAVYLNDFFEILDVSKLKTSRP